jgi:uncharacterized protein YbaR (Trm112 family)
VIEKDYKISFAANLALREKQIQQNYRPIIAVHKWFARRPGTLFRSLLLSEFSNYSLEDSFFKAGDLSGKTIADPFMGGGTPLLEANRLGADICGCDINPMAYWIVRQEMEHLDLASYRNSATKIRTDMESEIGHLYRTKCTICDNNNAHVKYFLWVKTLDCHNCGHSIDLFPGYVIAENVRHPNKVFICPTCGQLFELTDHKKIGNCPNCKNPLNLHKATKNKCRCVNCGEENKYPDDQKKPLRHRMFAIEYHCSKCKPYHKGRFFKAPDSDDYAKIHEAEIIAANIKSTFIPEDAIPAGDETNRLHKWGYTYYRELFNCRQLIGLEAICRLISKQPADRIRQALATNLSDLLRYQNMLCRYDTKTLKSLDIFSIHGFPVGLIQCESNILGILNENAVLTGSGGWLNIVEKFTKAKEYCDNPFEVRPAGLFKGAGKSIVTIHGEWIGGHRTGKKERKISLACADATGLNWEPNSLDGVFTDPPYFGNVQYAELIDFCYIWIRRLLKDEPAFQSLSTRNNQELTGNETLSRDLAHFTAGLSAAYTEVASALKPGSPFVFTYHHNNISAYYPVAAAILDAGLICTKVLPCPAEMGASIHISGTSSSTVDTVFVCRRKQDFPAPDEADLKNLLDADISELKTGGLKVTLGDIKCIIFGHMIKNTIKALADTWNNQETIDVKLDCISLKFNTIGGLSVVQNLSDEIYTLISTTQLEKSKTLFSGNIGYA